MSFNQLIKYCFHSCLQLHRKNGLLNHRFRYCSHRAHLKISQLSQHPGEGLGQASDFERKVWRNNVKHGLFIWVKIVVDSDPGQSIREDGEHEEDIEDSKRADERLSKDDFYCGVHSLVFIDVLD